MTKCPCCGGDVKADRPIVNLNTNVLMFGQTWMPLPPKEAELLSLVVRNYPNPVSRQNLVQRIWGTDEPSTADNKLSVYMRRLRAKIGPLGLNLLTQYGVGPYLEIEEAV